MKTWTIIHLREYKSAGFRWPCTYLKSNDTFIDSQMDRIFEDIVSISSDQYCPPLFNIRTADTNWRLPLWQGWAGGVEELPELFLAPLFPEEQSYIGLEKVQMISSLKNRTAHTWLLDASQKRFKGWRSADTLMRKFLRIGSMAKMPSRSDFIEMDERSLWGMSRFSMWLMASNMIFIWCRFDADSMPIPCRRMSQNDSWCQLFFLSIVQLIRRILVPLVLRAGEEV